MSLFLDHSIIAVPLLLAGWSLYVFVLTRAIEAWGSR